MQRQQAATEEARKKQLANKKVWEKRFNTAVKTFINAMKQAGNPGMTIDSKKSPFKQDIQGHWYWCSGKQSVVLENHYIKIYSSGKWELGEIYPDDHG